ncbi:hypothetical protein CTAYLR_010597 [Chrysophaeum taylorii]|uniref:PKD/REJ-like domain-containing protein n=1 Tax=Chrysophaeum taylorii TaxID=2483200 RepID=A0AAD7XLP2_9STRA|nr:hypothetical protein CTAYLR_010597 [Chrysophaeum taylorii]
MADATTTVCGYSDESSSTSRYLDYEWSLDFYYGGSASGLESTSRDPRVFSLDSYALDAATDYVLSVRVTDELTGNSSTHSVRVSCGRSDLEAVITGGSRSLPQRGVEIISAATSRDPDVRGATGAAAGLAFEWNCTNIYDLEDTSCTTAIIGDATSEELALNLTLLEYATTTTTTTTTTFRVAVSVTRREESRSSSSSLSLESDTSSASVELYHDGDPPSVSIDAASSVVLANERLVLTGSALTYVGPRAVTTALWLNTTWSVVQGAFVGGANLLDVSRSSLQVNRRRTVGSDSCRVDSTIWFKSGDESSTCDWVARAVRSRCDVVGQDGSLARDACLFSCTNGCLFVDSGQVNLVVERDSLIEGNSYTFELRTVLTDNSDAGFATVGFYVARSPRGGGVESNPRRGQALNTTFTISAFDWEADELPLLYGFGIEGGQILRVSTEDAVLRDVFLPAGVEDACDECSVTIVATIRDAIGASTTDSVEVVVTPNTQRGTALLTQVDLLLSKALEASSYEDVCNIAIASARTAPSDTDLLATIVDAIASARSLTQGSSEQTSLFAACLWHVTYNASAISFDTATLVLDEINGVIGEAVEIDYHQDHAKHSLDILSQLLDSSVFDELEAARRRLTTTTTWANESASQVMYEAIDTFSTKLVALLVSDEDAASVSATNADAAARRNSGAESVELATSGTSATLPEQSEAYAATLIELRKNARSSGGLLTSTSVVRFTAAAAANSVNTTASFLLPKSPNETLAPTSAPLRANVTLVCPWNSYEMLEVECPVDNTTIRRECNGTKYEEVVGCGLEVDEACVSWGSSDLAWTTAGCSMNSALSTSSSVACDCQVAIADSSANETAARDFGTQNVFATYSQLFLKNTFGGAPDVQRARIMLAILLTFVVVVLSLMSVGHLRDARDARAEKKDVGAPTAPDASSVEEIVVQERYLEYDDTLDFFLLDDDAEQSDDTDSDVPKIRVDFLDGRELDDDHHQAEAEAAAMSKASFSGGGEEQQDEKDERPGITRRHSSFRELTRSRSTLTSRLLENKGGIPPWQQRFKEALFEHYVPLSIWVVYSHTEPRAARILAFAFEILLVGACFAFEKQYEYPDPGTPIMIGIVETRNV